MLSDMNWSTVFATLAISSAYASICLIEASMIALYVPLIRSATKVGNSIAFSVARVTRAASLAARGLNSSAGVGWGVRLVAACASASGRCAPGTDAVAAIGAIV